VHRSHRGRRELILKVPGIRSFLIDHHHRIFEALVARDVQRSDELLRRHFEIGDEYRRKAFETPRPQG
jgi:GntR family transcriptional regulator, transcriptional repressor for pyruvate dehydrogenase complex